MKVTFLGTGTSHGVPVIGCSCPVCRSANPKNNRTRSSLHLNWNNTSLLIDASTDFRFQALREGMTSLDGILLTHAHADHIHGLDDIRIFTRDREIPVFGREQILNELRDRFSYIFQDTQKAGGKPQISLVPVSPGVPFEFKKQEFIPVGIKHGSLDILGYRWNRTAYLTDCSAIPAESEELLQDLDLLILGALRYTSHPTHFSVAEALTAAEQLKPRRVLFTHLSHKLEHEKLSAELPEGIDPAWDGLLFED